MDRTATLGLSVKGEPWNRPNDTIGLAGALTYGWKQILEAYYDFQVWKTAHFSFDYQFVNNPAFNRDRGLVSVIGARLHWQF